jgi:hypothetical protein
MAGRGIEAELCAGRPRCQLSSRQAVTGMQGSELLTVRLGEPEDAESDEEHCSRREYWLVRAAGNLLLSADCEVQWGADNPGPAQVELAEGRLIAHYIEYRASDNCEVVDATINLSSVSVERHDRQDGVVVRDQCQPRAASALPHPPAGDGTAARPLLVLHRP